MSQPIELKPLGRGGSSAKPPIPPRHPAAPSASAPTSASDSDAATGPGSLGRAYRLAEDKAKAAVHLQEGGLDVISIWGLVLASWSALLALPLLLFPRILLFFAQVPPSPSSSPISAFHSEREREDHYDALTPLESYLCLTLSLGLITLSLISLFTLVPTYEAPTQNPSRKPLLGILIGLQTVVSVITWNTTSIGGLGTALALGHTIVSLWGWWVAVFGIAGSHLTKKGKKSKVPQRFKKL